MSESKVVEMKVDASDLKHEEKDLVSKLSDFLKEKTGGEVSTAEQVVTVKGEGEALSKKYVKITVKKFLHKHDLTERFRVIGEKENQLKIKNRGFDEED
ncbi:MAG: 60S ribosomal protein L22 [Candidatus Bathyarchaeia archaeon]|jgi:hypothetical protein